MSTRIPACSFGFSGQRWIGGEHRALVLYLDWILYGVQYVPIMHRYKASLVSHYKDSKYVALLDMKHIII
jgi:hypothetical protein